MSKELKYVIYDYCGITVPVVFPSDIGITHKNIDVSDCKPISAGLCKLDGLNTQCYGNSPSLHLNSRPEIDAKIIIERFFQ